MREPTAHRPVITGLKGMASTGHSLASVEALCVLKSGGNAMDAALAAAAVLSVVKSYHCGLGGDVFALCYAGRDQKLYCLNGSGKSPCLLQRDRYKNGLRCMERWPPVCPEPWMPGRNWKKNSLPVAWQNSGSPQLSTR